MKFLFVLAAVAAVAAVALALSDSQIDDEWTKFKSSYNKSYESDSKEELRKNIFKENINKIETHNILYTNGSVTFKVAVNKFADLSSDEFVAQMNGYDNGPGPYGVTDPDIMIDGVPARVDWRDEGYVTAVKDQGDCAAGWAFSAIGALEGALYKSTGSLATLSEQQLLDCVELTHKTNNHCRKSEMRVALLHYSSGGMATESSYPYLGITHTCHDSQSDTVGYVSNIHTSKANEIYLRNNVAVVGPVSVAIDASNWSFQFYHAGIYYEENCSSSDLNHAALVVGYGGDCDSSKYWIVKNSWGTSWGESGYIRMARDKNNNCGIASQGSWPSIKR